MPRRAVQLYLEGQPIATIDARRVVRDIMARLADCGQVSEAVAKLTRDLLPLTRPRVGVVHRVGPTKLQQFRDALALGPVTDEALYTAISWGVSDGKAATWAMRKRCSPAARMWVKHEAGVYTLVGTGPNAPRGWTERARYTRIDNPPATV